MPLREELLQQIKPGARSFIRAGAHSLQHAYTHVGSAKLGDAEQVVMSLAHAVEMMCKGVLLHLGQDIFRDKGKERTKNLGEVIDALGSRPHSVEMLTLAGRRNPAYHFAAYVDPLQAQDYLEMARAYLQDLLRSEASLDLEQLVELPAKIGAAAAAERAEEVERSDALQRDAAYRDGALVWSQGSQGTRHLRVRLLAADGGRRWLTQEGDFEYMPCTDGRYVACYRQSGGVVLYDLITGERRTVVGTGGPGDIRDGVIAAQGISEPDGLGGGIWLLDLNGNGEWVSESGDSPRLADGWVLWQDFSGDTMHVFRRRVEGGVVEALASNAQHPSVDDNVMVFQETGSPAHIFGVELDAGKGPVLLADRGIFPNIHKGLVALLTEDAGCYGLQVVEWPSVTERLALRDVGFPTGRGPVLTDTHVVWEQRDAAGLSRLFRHPI